MKSAAVTLLAVAILLAGCRERAPEPAANIVEEELPRIPDVVPAKGCADHWTVKLNEPSFANNGAGRTFPRARLDAFAESIAGAATGAVAEACKAGEVDPAKARSISTLLVTSASGAAVPVFAEVDGKGTLTLEFVFAEADLTIPSEMELRAGLACWTDPQGEACAAMGP